MADYIYDPDDGKIHTRFTDLIKCDSPRGALAVAKEMVLGRKRWAGNDAMRFGTMRHDMFDAESRETGRTPEVFKQCGIDLGVKYLEQQWDYDLTPRVVLHSRTDAYCESEAIIIDYKTGTGLGSIYRYKSSHQLKTYALQLMAAGNKVKRLMYLGEMWDRERENIEGYEKLTINVDLTDLMQTKKVLIRNAEFLVAAIDLLNEERKILSTVEKHS